MTVGGEDKGNEKTRPGAFKNFLPGPAGNISLPFENLGAQQIRVPA